MNFFEITNNKYVDYFSSVDKSSINDEIMNEFLNKMIEASESLDKDNTIHLLRLLKKSNQDLALMVVFMASLLKLQVVI